ncbi:MAG: NAD(P)/FAD-dependent oxidoreductase [Planctomycetes bacterium]|nr:NAD(P)/FAD-dependent oxidoreductase [Planctomycetota bacterium]
MVVGEFTVETELVVIGGGPGGYSAAFRAADLGIATTIVDDRDRLGGTWLHAGCIRSKELASLADVIRAAARVGDAGISFGPPKVDLEQIRVSLDDTVARHAQHLEAECERLNITRVQGHARFESSRQISVEGNPEVPRIRFRRAVIACGTRPVAPRGIDPGSSGLLDTGSALLMPGTPPRLLVVGGSSSALEIASIYATLGSRVTLVDRHDQLLPHADPDLVSPLRSELECALDGLHLGAWVESWHSGPEGLDVTLGGSAETASPRRFDAALVAAGREAHVESLGLERTEVHPDKASFVHVDDQMRTTDPRIFAVGDVTGEPMLALKAAHQGHIAGEVVAGWESRYDTRAVPMVLFTEPQLAWCGLTETQSAAMGIEFRVERCQWAPAGPGSTGTGFTKIIHDPASHVILGVGIVGRGAAELIAEAALALEMGAVTTDLAATMHPHPTRGEFIAAAARRVEDAQDSTAEST